MRCGYHVATGKAIDVYEASACALVRQAHGLASQADVSVVGKRVGGACSPMYYDAPKRCSPVTGTLLVMLPHIMVCMDAWSKITLYKY